MELWQMVVADHPNIEELCREVLRATGSGPNSRAELFADLQDELERHIAAQQNVLYPALSAHERTAAYLADLEGKRDEILRELDPACRTSRQEQRRMGSGFQGSHRLDPARLHA